MELNCNTARNWIPKVLAGDLDSQSRSQLELHLQACRSCSKEQELYADTLEQLRCLSDVSAPRHFFVYPEERSSALMEFFRVARLRWLLAGLAGLILMVCAGLAISGLRFNVEEGVYSLSFGEPLPEDSRISPTRQADIATLKAELVRLLEARSQREREEWMNTLRREFRQTTRKMSRQQERQWNAALATLEARISDRMEDQSLALKASVDRSMGNLYQTLQSQRQQDLATTRSRLDQITALGELKDQETEEILSTLLQVAEFKVK
jgi:Putative zinc-finger